MDYSLHCLHKVRVRVSLHIFSFIASHPVNINKERDRAKERITQRQEKLSAGEEREANKWGRRGGWVDEQQAILSRWREGQKRKLAENLSRHMFNIMAHLQPNTQKCVFGVTQMVRMKAGTAEEKYNNLRMNCSQVIVGSNTKNQTRNKYCKHNSTFVVPPYFTQQHKGNSSSVRIEIK